MRFYDIVLFVFLFNVAAGIFAEVGMFQICEGSNCELAYSYEPDIETINKSTETVLTEEYSTQSMSLFDTITSMVWGFARGLVMMTHIFIQATIGVPVLMIKLFGGDPSCLLSNDCGTIGNIAFYISAIVYLIYVVGLVQFLAGRYFSTME